MKALDDHEFKRMWRVVDTALSGHAILRDRYRRRETGLTLLVIVLSIIATALAFLSGDTVIEVGHWQLPLAMGLGTLTATIFFLALAELVFSWQRLAWLHDDGVRRLAKLKAKLRSVKVAGVSSLSSADGVDVRNLYDETMEDIIEIPEDQFLGLKAKHRAKVAVSRLIDSHPGAPLWYLRALAMLQGLRMQQELDNSNHEPDEPVEAPPT